MIKKKKKLLLSIALFALGNLLFNINPSYSINIDDFTIKSVKLAEETHLDENYPKVKELLSLVDKKVSEHEKSFKNTNYKKAREEVEQAEKYLNISKYAYKLGNIKKAIESLNKTLSNLRTAQLDLMPSRVAETRGLYLDADSIPTDKKGISLLIKEIKKANFNIIYPEVFRRGYSIFPNTVSDTDERFKNLKFDVLKTIIDEAHSQNLEVYPWFWTFRIKSPLYDDSFFKKYPDLIARRQVYRFEDRESLFLSPAEPKSRTLILKILRQLTINYKIDGLLLDYIRYDETLGDDILTRKYFREYFLNKYGKEPPENITINNPYFNEWQIWREEQVTTMVKNVRRQLSLIRPELKIGVAIFRTEKEGRLLKMQDWRHWANNNYIDFVCPMLYTDNNRDLTDWLNSETDKNTRSDYLYPSLGAHRFNTADDFFPEAGLLYKRNIPGMNIFSLLHLGRENLPDLSRGVFRKHAEISDKNPINSVKEILSDTSKWLKGIAYNESKIPVKNLKNLIYKIDTLNNKLNTSSFNYQDIKVEIDKLSEYNISLKKDNGFPEALVSEITEPLNYILRLLEIDNNIKNNNSTYSPPILPPIPANEGKR